MEGNTEGDTTHQAESDALKKVFENVGTEGMENIIKDAVSPEKKTYNVGVLNRDRIKKLVVGVNVTSDYLDLLEDKVRGLIKEGKNRALANGRKRILARDI
jgi:hypothetical protein